MTTVPPYYLPSNPSELSLTAPTLPPYTEYASADPGDEAIELASLSPSTSTSSTTTTAGPSSSSSPLAPAPSLFTPTKHLQIQTPGKSLLSFPLPPRPDPIPIFTLTPEGHLDRPLYLSVRPSARSGSCFLTYGDDERQTPLATTTYRFGPGRAPVVHLGDLSGGGVGVGVGAEDGEQDGGIRQGEEEQGFEVRGTSLFSRAVRFTAPGLGSFGWRYANSRERASVGADSLLVCEVFPPDPHPTADPNHHHHHHQPKASVSARFGLGRRSDGDQDSGNTTTPSTITTTTTAATTSSGSSSSNRISRKGGKETNATPRRIAQLVRNETFRSPGTSRSTAGNGGRLMLDLTVFDEKARERVEWLVVTTALTMLKREVDRRRAQQAATIAALVS
ncbi:hypothetical protein GGR51DRAFT_22311 [Nemania sp. FL0031]|nr:hypothetical protein GGR51DRAFT_22311 [Nemania sp. FL0031]